MAKTPTGRSPRLPCATHQESRPKHYLTYWVEGLRAIARKRWELVNLQTIIQQAADPNFLLAINMSARDSHYRHRHFFCNTFFRFVSTQNQLQFFADRTAHQCYFQVTQTSLEWEDTTSHHSVAANVLCVWIVASASERHAFFLENLNAITYSKNCSPNVWRNEFVFIFCGPTISWALTESMDQLRCVTDKRAMNEGLTRSSAKLFAHAAHVCKVF